MIYFTVTRTGLDRLAARYSNRANFLGADGMRPLMKSAADDLTRIFRRNIDAMTPGAFQDLAESTKKQKQQQVGFVYPMLKRTGQLYDSVRNTVMSPSSSSGWTISTSFDGSHTGGQMNEKIAAVHIEGQGRMPKRDFTTIPDSWRKSLIQNIRDALHNL